MSAQAYGASCPAGTSHHFSGSPLVQLMPSGGSVHVATHPDTRARCEGRVQESTGANIRSWSTNRFAYVQ